MDAFAVIIAQKDGLFRIHLINVQTLESNRRNSLK